MNGRNRLWKEGVERGNEGKEVWGGGMKEGMKEGTKG